MKKAGNKKWSGHYRKNRAYYRDYYQKNRERIKQKRQERKATFPEYQKWAYKKHKYGISRKEFEAMLERQGRVCAICGSHQWGKLGPHVDHDHSTGEVRGLLCGHCNWTLGFAREDIVILKKMIEYIGKNR